MIEIKGQTLTLPIESIKPNPWNPNQQTDFMFEHQKHSMEKWGQILPVVCREKGKFYEIIDGEHRWKAAKEKGATELEIKNLGKVSDADAMQLTEILNQLKGTNDQHKLAELMGKIRSMVSLEEMFANLPIGEAEINALLAASQVDWEKIKPQLPPGEKEEKGSKSSQTFTIELSTPVFKAFDKALVKIEKTLDIERSQAVKWLADFVLSNPVHKNPAIILKKAADQRKSKK